jgi:hypothetical protein
MSNEGFKGKIWYSQIPFRCTVGSTPRVAAPAAPHIALDRTWVSGIFSGYFVDYSSLLGKYRGSRIRSEDDQQSSV